MKNSVSARLSERTAPEVAAAIYEPSLLNFSAAALERMCALNEAHVVMLQARGLITTDIARTIPCIRNKCGNGDQQAVDRALHRRRIVVQDQPHRRPFKGAQTVLGQLFGDLGRKPGLQHGATERQQLVEKGPVRGHDPIIARAII